MTGDHRATKAFPVIKTIRRHWAIAELLSHPERLAAIGMVAGAVGFSVFVTFVPSAVPAKPHLRPSVTTSYKISIGPPLTSGPKAVIPPKPHRSATHKPSKAPKRTLRPAPTRTGPSPSPSVSASSPATTATPTPCDGSTPEPPTCISTSPKGPQA